MNAGKILVVEDTPTEVTYVKSLLGEKGLIVGTYRDFAQTLEHEKVYAVLSDLYFPSGYAPNSPEHATMKHTLVTDLSMYLTTHFKENPILKVLELCQKSGLGNNLEEVVEELKKREGEGGIIPKFKDLIDARIKQGEEEKAYKTLRGTLESDQHLLPLGVLTYQTAKKQGIPCIIVTDAYHHGIEFQPFVGATGRYFDRFIEGHKQWDEAIRALEIK